MEFLLPRGDERVVLDEQVLRHLESHRQTRLWHREAGGQLFARFDPGAVLVERITGPRRTDRRSRASYHPDRAAEQREIHDMHALGFHYVGDWHTHPETLPLPSAVDRSAMVDMFANSSTQAEGFLLVVVGTAPFPRGLHASWIGHAGMIALQTMRAGTSKMLGPPLFEW